ncbi:hypothetical protein [Paraburkholderia saeva]|uniref:Uncharacterized protein n=1 Tax=Paraburkholderia saeva TaxID=2777537 RepID=A0A9N8X5R6_9BURK|nr:hypothetical protein [Paraburkholderia saeva]CAG4922218.1 hypothetical protein R70241_05041 [Paraburkholderia saeva]CAG4926090.1 hypothetical protein LMG31841_05552 [Paraburkholderia saeva]CAG4927194.1 hypothetical protein R52603_05546 [Paraburkholderia saeva]
MKRIVAMLVFLTGGIGFELSTPFSCSLIHTSRPTEKRRTY